jgi:NAD(P)-dependent dehydrogenase (short-subunit alcohol dehydrogenase family)
MTGIETNVEGKVAIVTGGSRGIGKAVATVLAGAGAKVMITSRKADVCAAAAAEIGHGCQWRAANVSDGEAAAGVVNDTMAEFGAIDILVNNAATNPYAGPVIDADVPRWEKTFQVNLTSPLQWVQLVWAASMRDNGGAIVNVASVGGYVTSRFIGSYNISKSALMHLTRQLAAELAPGVRVNAVAPGLVKTDFARFLWEGDKEATAAEHYPLKRIGEVEDIANAVHFLASDASSWVTGQTVVLDGGGLIRFGEEI